MPKPHEPPTPSQTYCLHCGLKRLLWRQFPDCLAEPVPQTPPPADIYDLLNAILDRLAKIEHYLTEKKVGTF